MPPLVTAVALLSSSAVLIYLSCAFFVNGVEWVGRQMAVGRQATGTILAAFGTALPESVVTFVAVVFGVGATQKALGIGAALGGPLALSTIAYATVGLVLILTGQHLARDVGTKAEFKRLSRDQGWFLLIFTAKIGLGLVAFPHKPWLGIVFIAVYLLYFRTEMRRVDHDHGALLEPLKLARKSDAPPAWLAMTQTLVALAFIFAASRVFVSQLGVLGAALGAKPQLLSLLLSPVATELPETMNAIIWVRQGKHRLALANISGAMMIQATVPTAFGLLFTPWLLDPPLVIGAAVTAAAITIMFIAFARGLISRRLLVAMGALYIVFICLLVLQLQGGR